TKMYLQKNCNIKSFSISYKPQNINISDEGNSVGSGQQSVSVNNEHNVANVDNNNGWDSWNSIWDYGTGFAATRLFAKKLCIVHEINKEAVPPIHVLDALAKEKKLINGYLSLTRKGPGGPPPKSLVYSVNPNQVDDLNKFGKSITNMCRKIPTYLAEEIRGESLLFSLGICFKTDIFGILNISLCGKVVA
uniref:Gastrokine-1 n=1 Tax=Loxodonta africana TaxID=9785 RepID=G3SQ11_LOXAF